MFFKLASGPVSLIFGGLGFISMLALNLLGRRGWLSSLTGAFFGALGFLAVWFIMIFILTTLFTAEELSQIFGKSPRAKVPPMPAPAEYKLEDDAEGELTAEDLYAPSESLPHIFPGQEAPTLRPLTDGSKNSNKSASGLDSTGAFDFQTGDRVLRTNAKEAALAARKVLMNDKK